jgi:hypothetical protein
LQTLQVGKDLVFGHHFDEKLTFFGLENLKKAQKSIIKRP